MPANSLIFERQKALNFKFPFFFRYKRQLQSFLGNNKEAFQSLLEAPNAHRSRSLSDVTEELLPQFEELDLINVLREQALKNEPEVFRILFEDLIADLFPDLKIISEDLKVDSRSNGHEDVMDSMRMSVNLSLRNEIDEAILSRIPEVMDPEFGDIGGELFFLNLLSKIPLLKKSTIGSFREDPQLVRLLFLFGMMLHMRKAELEDAKKLMQLIGTYPRILIPLSKAIQSQNLDEEFFLCGGWSNVIYVEVFSHLERLKNNLESESYFEVIELLHGYFDQDSPLLQKTLRKKLGQSVAQAQKKLSSLLKLKAFFIHLKQRICSRDFKVISGLCLKEQFNITKLLLPIWEQFELDEKMGLAELEKINDMADFKWMKWEKNLCVKLKVFTKSVDDRNHSDGANYRDRNSQQILRNLRAALTINKKVVGEGSLVSRLREVMHSPLELGKNAAAQESFKEFVIFIIKSILKKIKDADENPEKGISREEKDLIRVWFCQLVQISERSYEVINLVVEYSQGNLMGHMDLVLESILRIRGIGDSSSPESKFLIAFLDKMTQMMKEQYFKDKQVYTLSLARLSSQLNIDLEGHASLILNLLGQFSSFRSSGKAHLNLFNIFYFLRTELSILCSKGLSENNQQLISLLDKLKRQKGDRVFNTCRFFLLAEIQSSLKFLSTPKNFFHRYLPECHTAKQAPLKLDVFTVSSQASYAQICKYIQRVWTSIYSKEPFEPLRIGSPGDFFLLCSAVVNARYNILSLSNDPEEYRDFCNKLMSLLSPSLDAQFEPFQKQYVRDLLDGLPGSRILRFPSQDQEIKGELILLVLNVTSLCVAFYQFSWIFSNIIKSFRAKKSPPILFNLKDILIMNDRLNKQMAGRKFYECINCGTPFNIGNCGKADSLGNCVKCKQAIGGENHTANPNTREIDINQFQNKILHDPHYFANNYSANKNTTFRNFHPLTFRMGHALTHCLYLGCAEALFGQNTYDLLIPNFQMNFSHLGIARNQRGLFFYRHIDRDMETLQKLTGIRQGIIPVVASQFQLLVDHKDNFRSASIPKSEKLLESLFHSFGNDPQSARGLVDQVKGSKEGFSSMKNQVEKVILREDVSEATPFIDHFLYINLRKTKNININNFELELDNYKNENPEKQFQYLDFYLRFKVLR